MTAPGAFELHRTRWMRFGGGPLLQPVFVLAFVIWLIFAVRNDEPVFLVIPAIAVGLWLFGATAFVRVDNTGIHRRCYLSRVDAWADISSIELRTLSLGYRPSARRQICIHRAHGRHYLAPASGNTRYNEEFARLLLTAARARGIEVTTSGWGGFDA